MLRTLVHEIRPALVLLVALTLLTGVAYPLVVLGIGRVLFPVQAGGSLVLRGGTVVGSRLLAQATTSTLYFHPRPSAVDYNAAASGGSNLAPSNPALVEAVRGRVAAIAAFEGTTTVSIPPDLVTASASGLDPHISPASALVQVPRVARARGLDARQVQLLVEKRVEPRTMGILGEPRVNVLMLNLDLDAAAGRH